MTQDVHQDVHQDEQDVRAVVAGRAEAMRAGDAARLTDGCSPDALLYTLAPPLRQPAGAAKDTAALQAWFDGHGGRVGFDVTDLDVTVDGDLAVCTSLNRMGAPDDTPGHRFSLWFRATLVLRRDGGRWQVVHEHESTPFHMDGSFTAAVDLEPE